jgi:anaphase-promoting complex subunit 8
LHLDNEGKLDGFLLYLYGMALQQAGQETNAITALTRSVTLYPYNWSAWINLGKCMMAENQQVRKSNEA